MKLSNMPYNVLEFSNDYREGKIRINRDYQRSNEVWPNSARSFLVETVLMGFPLPKLCLHQKTDLKKKTSTKEIVDGQQRTQAIVDFLEDKFALSSDAELDGAQGKKFSQLSADMQANFVEYDLSIDLLVGATDEDIRELFRRINSYTAPLNFEEQRHAKFQGKFKWFVVSLCKKHTGFLKRIGTLSNRNIVRMADAKAYTEFCFSLERGLQTTKAKELDSLYDEFDKKFEDKTRGAFEGGLANALSSIGDWPDLHETALTKKTHVVHMLLVALAHQQQKFPELDKTYKFGSKKPAAKALALLLGLAEALELEDPDEIKKHPAEEFIRNSNGKTNVRETREVRFRWLCSALEGEETP